MRHAMGMMPDYAERLGASNTVVTRTGTGHTGIARTGLWSALLAATVLLTALPAAADTDKHKSKDSEGTKEFFLQSGFGDDSTRSYTAGLIWNWDWKHKFDFGRLTG